MSEETREVPFKISYFNMDGSWHGSDVFRLEVPDINARQNTVAAAEHVIGVRDGTNPARLSTLDADGDWKGFIALYVEEHHDGMPILILPHEGFEALIKRLQSLPATWYPAVLKEVVQSSYSQEVWRPGGAARFIGQIERSQAAMSKLETPASERPHTENVAKAKADLYCELIGLPAEEMTESEVELMYHLSWDEVIQEKLRRQSRETPGGV